MGYYKGSVLPIELILSTVKVNQTVPSPYNTITFRQYSRYISSLPANIENMFSKSDFVTLPKLNSSKVKGAMYAFKDSTKLICLDGWDLSSLTSASDMFNGCERLKYFNPTEEYDCYFYFPLECGMHRILKNCRSIVSLCINLGGNTLKSGWMEDAFHYMTALTDFNIVNGNIKVNSNFKPFGAENGGTWVSSLSIDSIVNFLNALADNTGEYQYTVVIPMSVYNLLSDEQKAIATNKNLLLKGE